MLLNFISSFVLAGLGLHHQLLCDGKSWRSCQCHLDPLKRHLGIEIELKFTAPVVRQVTDMKWI